MKQQQQLIFEHISSERDYQDVAHPLDKGGFPCDPGKRLGILVEEVGEVGKAICEEKRLEIRKELIHAAAVAVRWIEMIDDEAIKEMQHLTSQNIEPSEYQLEAYRAAIRRRSL